jgi:hypothetical protein
MAFINNLLGVKSPTQPQQAAGKGAAKPLDQATIDQYLRASGYDATRAEAAMKRDGYSLDILITPAGSGR